MGLSHLNQTNSYEKLNIFPLRLQKINNNLIIKKKTHQHLMLKAVRSTHDTVSEALGLLPALCIRSEFPYSQRKRSISWIKEKVPFTLQLSFHSWFDWTGARHGHMQQLLQPPENNAVATQMGSCFNVLCLGHSARKSRRNLKGCCLKSVWCCPTLWASWQMKDVI